MIEPLEDVYFSTIKAKINEISAAVNAIEARMRTIEKPAEGEVPTRQTCPLWSSRNMGKQCVAGNPTDCAEGACSYGYYINGVKNNSATEHCKHKYWKIPDTFIVDQFKCQKCGHVLTEV